MALLELEDAQDEDGAVTGAIGARQFTDTDDEEDAERPDADDCKEEDAADETEALDEEAFLRESRSLGSRIAMGPVIFSRSYACLMASRHRDSAPYRARHFEHLRMSGSGFPSSLRPLCRRKTKKRINDYAHAQQENEQTHLPHPASPEQMHAQHTNSPQRMQHGVVDTQRSTTHLALHDCRAGDTVLEIITWQL
jgi:hypothetical protein